MDIIVDANILFASLIKDGFTAELLFTESLRLYAPEFLLEEVDKYRDLLKKKTERTDREFDEFLRILKRQVTFVPKEEIEVWLDDAKRISPDPADAPYIALAIKKGCGIWTNDIRLKNQKAVAIYSTREIMELLG